MISTMRESKTSTQRPTNAERKPKKGAEHKSQKRRQEGERHRQPAALHDSREHVSAQHIGAERVLPRHALPHVPDGRRVVVGTERRSEQQQQKHETQNADAQPRQHAHRAPQTTPLPPRVTKRQHGATSDWRATR